MITLLLASLLATPQISYKLNTNWTSILNRTEIVLNNNSQTQALRYDIRLIYFGSDDYKEYRLDIGGNVFDFAIYADLGSYQSGSDTYLTSQYYFATKDLYHSNLYFSHIVTRYVDDDSGDNLYPDNIIGEPNVYFYQNNAFKHTDNPIIPDYIYYYGTYDDDKFYDERIYTGSLTEQEISLELDLTIELLPQELVNGTDYQNGYTAGWNEGNDNGFEDGYQSGYTNGYKEAEIAINEQGATATLIFSGIIDVALLPINFFLACLNFEVFGINIGSIVTATMTIAILLILYRTIFAGGNGGGKND